jgi:hypothetical protein
MCSLRFVLVNSLAAEFCAFWANPEAGYSESQGAMLPHSLPEHK